jgi:hypothetical protein
MQMQTSAAQHENWSSRQLYDTARGTVLPGHQQPNPWQDAIRQNTAPAHQLEATASMCQQHAGMRHQKSMGLWND